MGATVAPSRFRGRFCRWALVQLVLYIAAVAEDDMECLSVFKSSVLDAHNSLSSWSFYHNDSVGAVDPCYSFVGVGCWDDGRVMILELEGMRLSGRFPSGLSACGSLETVSLANNSFTGPLPSDLCHQIPYLSSLDLSNNNFSGDIPSDIHNCEYLNKLHLQHNQFNDSIPWGIGILPRLSDLDLSYNALSGPIPSSFTNRSLLNQKPFSASTFRGNPLLCGPPLSTTCSTKSPMKLNKLVIAGVSVLSMIFLIATIASGFACWRRQWKRGGKTCVIPDLFDANLMRVTWDDLRQATSNFSKSNIVGVGGSSKVYKAKLGSSKTVAVKVLQYSSTGVDEGLVLESNVCKQFLTELEVLGKLRHRNLVKILSYCYNLNSMALVLDYMAMGSLDAVLHSKIPSRHLTESQELRPFIMNWQARIGILVNIAEGLQYLHREYDGKCCVIHGDLKPSNVLLDEHMEAHIADFGLARFVASVDTASFGMRSRKAVTGEQWWSIGYTAPECAQQGVVSRRSDVFSFGVMALEVMTGERPSSSRLEEGQTLAEWVGKAIAMGAARTVVASTLRTRDWSKWAADITAALKLACDCASKTPSPRPDMRHVASILRELNERLLVHVNHEHDDRQVG